MQLEEEKRAQAVANTKGSFEFCYLESLKKSLSYHRRVYTITHWEVYAQICDLLFEKIREADPSFEK